MSARECLDCGAGIEWGGVGRPPLRCPTCKTAHEQGRDRDRRIATFSESAGDAILRCACGAPLGAYRGRGRPPTKCASCRGASRRAIQRAGYHRRKGTDHASPPSRYISCPAINKRVPLGIYVAGIKAAKAQPDVEFKHGLTTWGPTTGREIVRQFMAGVHDRINAAVPYIERGVS